MFAAVSSTSASMSGLRVSPGNVPLSVAGARAVRTYAVSSLPSAEERMLAALLTLIQPRLGDAWQLTPSGAPDVVFVGEAADNVTLGALMRSGAKKLVFVGASVDEANALRLPLRPTEVKRVLEDVSRSLTAMHSEAPFTFSQPPREHADMLHREHTESPPREHAEISANLSAVTRTVAARTEPLIATSAAPARLYRLRRWPSQNLINGDPRRAKIAACMMHKLSPVEEIAERAQVQVGACTAFLENLMRLDQSALLTTLAGSDAALGATGIAILHGTRLATETMRLEPPAKSLISRIRKRLGI